MRRMTGAKTLTNGQRQILAGVLALASVLSTEQGRASPEFPGQLRKARDIPCVPTCMLCHNDPNGGKGTSNQFAPRALAAMTLVSYAFNEDYDGDGMNDGEELKNGRSPVIFGAVSVCVPEFGCGARLTRPAAPGVHDARPWLVGIIALLAGVGWKRRQTRRKVTNGS